MATEDILELGIDVDTKSAVRSMADFERQMKHQMKTITKMVEDLGKASSKSGAAAAAGTDAWTRSLKDLTGATKDQKQALQNLESRAKSASGAELEGIKKTYKQIVKEIQTKSVGLFNMKKIASNMKSTLSTAWGDFKKTVGAFFSKDLKGMVDVLGGRFIKVLGAGVGGVFGKAGSLASKAGKGIGGIGGRMSKAGKARGGMSGAAMGGAGAAMKALGGAIGKMGPMLRTLAKIGPLIATASTAILAVVKVLIDAESQAKGFQKQILQAASSAEFLADSGGNVDVAFNKMSGTLAEIRKSAFSLDNLKWGISSEEHVQTLNTLTQAGVSLSAITKEAQRSGVAVGEFTAELTHVGVAYSRAFGLPLQEIMQLQAEMSTEMGMSLESTKLAFEQMTRGASESGIAANKFFAIIRGVSQDLSLYNMRMEQSVKLLKMLGKVMNPREAQKFMQFATQGLKNMSQDDRLKMNLLAGGKATGIIQKDLKSKRKNLADDITKALNITDKKEAKKIQAAVNSGDASEWINKIDPSKRGAIKSASLDLKTDTIAAGRGKYGEAFAMENLSAGASLDMMTAALTRFTGGGSLIESAGSLGLGKTAEMLGVSTDILRGQMKMAVAVEDQKKALVKSGKKTADEVKAMSTQDILETLSAEEQSTLKKGVKKTMTAAEKQSELTSTLVDKLGVLVDFVMNKLYGVLQDMWMVLKAFGMTVGISFDDNSAERASRQAAFDDKPGGMVRGAVDAAKKAKSGGGSYEQALVSNLIMGKGNLGDSIAKAMKHDSGSTQAGLESSEFKSTNAAVERLVKSLGGSMRAGRSDKEFGDAVARSMASAGVSKEKQEAARKMALGGEKDFSKIMYGAGLSNKEMQGTVQKSLWEIDGGMLAKMAHTIKGDAENVGQARVIGAKKDGASSEFGSSDEAKKLLEKQAGHAKTGADASAKLAKAGTTPSTLYVKWSTPFLKKWAKTTESTVLDAVRQALWEYYLYSEEQDRGKLLEKMDESGMSPMDLFKQLKDSPQTVGSALNYEVMDKNAVGGVVTGVSNGLANVRAAAGEGLTSIGKGEVIVPRGGAIGRNDGGSTRVEISVKPGFEQFIEAKVIDGIQDARRREKFN